MNLLKNKKLIRNLLKQGDLINTINGGVALTAVEQIQNKDNFEIKVSAPSVSAHAFNVVLNFNQLVVFSVLPSNEELLEEESAFNIPMFFKTFELPTYIDKENIEAIHEDGILRVILPFKNLPQNMRKKIDIRHL